MADAFNGHNTTGKGSKQAEDNEAAMKKSIR